MRARFLLGNMNLMAEPPGLVFCSHSMSQYRGIKPIKAELVDAPRLCRETDPGNFTSISTFYRWHFVNWHENAKSGA